MMDIDQRPQYFTCHNGPKEALPFSAAEYDRRLASLLAILTRRDIPVVLLKSVHNRSGRRAGRRCTPDRN